MWKDTKKEKPEVKDPAYISELVMVKLKGGRKTLGQWDSSRGVWFCVGSMEGEVVEYWDYIPD